MATLLLCFRTLFGNARLVAGSNLLEQKHVDRQLAHLSGLKAAMRRASARVFHVFDASFSLGRRGGAGVRLACTRLRNGCPLQPAARTAGGDKGYFVR